MAESQVFAGTPPQFSRAKVIGEILSPFRRPVAIACPPVGDCVPLRQARPAEEVARLPGGSAITENLSDYAVMRGQARGCKIRA